MSTAKAVDGPATAGADLGSAARHGLIGLAGSVVAAAAGLLLNVVVGRGLGPDVSGVFFVVVAVLTVAMTVGKLGADTGLVWALSRARTLGRGADTRRTLAVALLPAVLASALLAAGVYGCAPLIAAAVDPSGTLEVDRLLRVSAPFLLAAAPCMVLAAGLRGVGSITGYTLVQNVLVPGLRPLLAGVVIAAGLGVTAALLTWSAPLVLGVAVAAVLLHRRTAAAASAPGAAPRPWRAVGGEFWRFSAPRSVTAALEVALVWSDVLLVAALATPRDAGIYAAASRFITTGTLAEAAMRIALSPQVSSLLAVGDVRATGRLCATGTQWVVLVAWPIYLALALYSPFVLSLFGPGFPDGAVALSTLAVAMLLVMAAGNNQTVLLMSGRSTWQLANKACALTVNLGLNVWLVPRYGMEGAAVSWSVAVVLDALLAVVQVRRGVGVRMPMVHVLPAVAMTTAAFVPPGLVVLLGSDRGAVASLAGLAVSTVCLVLLVAAARRHLDVAPLRDAVRRGR